MTFTRVNRRPTSSNFNLTCLKQLRKLIFYRVDRQVKVLDIQGINVFFCCREHTAPILLDFCRVQGNFWVRLWWFMPLFFKFNECGRFGTRKVFDVLLYFFCFEQLGLCTYFEAPNVTQRLDAMSPQSFAHKLNDKNQILNFGGCSSPLLIEFKHRRRFPNIEIKRCTLNFNSDSFCINQALARWSSVFKPFMASSLFTSLAVRRLAVKAFKSEFLARISAFDAHAPNPLQR